MSNIQVNRIKNKLEELFADKINMSNISDSVKPGTGNYMDMWFTRAYSAYSTFLMGSESVDDAVKSVTDGFGDGGIDVIYNDQNKKILYFVQTKFSNKANGTISEGDVHKFIRGVDKILRLNFDGFNTLIKNRQVELSEALSDFDYRMKIVICLSSNQSLSSHADEAIKEFLDKSNSDGGEELISFELIKLNDIYSHMANQGNPPKVDLDNVLVHNWGQVTLDTYGYKVYYGWVSAADVVDWRNQHGDRIFEKNIRNFKQNTDVNNGILSVLKTEPEKFYLYNNGIKLIAESEERSLSGAGNKDYLRIKLNGVSIINGAQTTGSLHKASSDEIDLSNVSVQVQIIVLGDGIEDVGQKITKLSNTQNRIENKDFASQDKEQERLAKDLAIDGKLYVYRQGVKLPSDEESCDIDSATIALGCFLNDVTISTQLKRAFGSIFDNISRPPYKLIFNSGTSAYRLWNCVDIYKKVQLIESEYQADPENLTRKLISVHGNRFILHMILQELKSEGLAFETRYIDVWPDLRDRYVSIVENLMQAKLELFPDAYPANLFKNSNRTKKLKERLLV